MSARKYILIVEDDRFLSDIYKRKLEQEGYEVDIAPGGKEGLALIEQRTPDLLILDLIMPGISGFDVLEQINDKEKIAFPVLVLSNLGQVSDQTRVKLMGVNDYFLKTSVSIDEVMARVKKLLKV